MKRYPEYKESGVEWIGEVPSHWKILPFMHCLKKVKTLKKMSIPKMDYQESGEFPIIDQGASFIAGWTNLTDLVISDNLPVVIFGDHTRIFKYIDFPFALGADGTQLLYPNDNVLNPRFFFYALLNLEIPNRGYNRHYRYLRKFSVTCPALSTQLQIANFLDRKTKQIDELIHITERKIALLREQRTVLINQAVTKGLDPNVEMKPSGVEWIGKIPRHWEVVRSKHIFGNRNQRGAESEPLLSVTQAQGILPRNKLDYRVWNPEGNIKLYKLVKPGDWVISLRTFEGGIELSEVRGIVSAAYTTMFSRRQIFNSYFKYSLKSVGFIAELNRITTGIRQGKNIAYEDFSDTRIAFPPLSEQKVIGNFLDRKTEQIDTLIAAEQRKIELLKEYRQSLISEAVTGKIDVRDER